MIYLIGSKQFDGVLNIVLNKIIYKNFNINLKEYDCLIITSKNALKSLKKTKSHIDYDINLYAVGEQSAKYAEKMGFKNIKFPSQAYGKNLLNEYLEEFRGKKCLYLRAKKITSKLDEELLKQNINLTQIIAYENLSIKPSITSLSNQANIFVFSAPSTLENFLKYFKFKDNDKVVVIGQSTALKLANFKNLYICEEQNLNSCIKLAKSLNSQHQS